jgi:uncharacterized protein YkwD
MFARLPAALAVVHLLLLHTTSASTSHPRNSRTSADYTDATLFQTTILNMTNAYRAQHNASRLTWNTTLAAYATAWSEKCVFAHSGGPSGENLAAGYPGAGPSVAAWGDERAEYDFRKGGFR